MKPKFIENLETEAGIFSKMVSYDRSEKFVQNLLTKKYKISSKYLGFSPLSKEETE